jgi:transcriptional regulator CtsR
MRSTLESLIEALLPYIDRSKISDIVLQNIVEEHMLMEREQTLRDMIQDDEELGLYETK